MLKLRLSVIAEVRLKQRLGRADQGRIVDKDPRQVCESRKSEHGGRG